MPRYGKILIADIFIEEFFKGNKELRIFFTGDFECVRLNKRLDDMWVWEGFSKYFKECSPESAPFYEVTVESVIDDFDNKTIVIRKVEEIKK